MKNSKTQFQTRVLRAAILAVSMGVFSVITASAATDTWTGGVSPSGNWSAGGNWLSGTPPTPADALVFASQSGAAASPTDNFVAGTLFDGLTFGSSSAGSTFALTGNSILLSGNTNGITVGVTNAASLTETVNNNLALDWGYHMFYSPAAGSGLNLNGSITANLGGVANFGPSNVNSTVYVQDGTGLIAGLGAAGLMGDAGLGANSGGGFGSLATVSNGVVVAYNSYSSAHIIGPAAAPIGADDITTLTTGFASATVVSSVVVTSTTGIQVGDAFVGTGVPNSLAPPTVTSVTGATVNLTPFTSTAASVAGSYTFAASAADPANIEITGTTAGGSFSLAGGTSTTYGTNVTYVNTALLTINGITKVTSLDVPGGNGTLDLGSMNASSGLYVGGIYLPGGQTVQEITIGGGGSTFLTSGPMSGNPVPGEIIIGVNGDNTSNEGEMNCVIKDNLSGGKVSVVYAGGGSLYYNTAGSTYSGGTYLLRGRLQCNQLTALGAGPVYIGGNDAEISLQNVPVGTMTNAFFLSPGCSSVEAPAEGALRLSGIAGAEFLTNTITLMGNPIVPGVAAGTTPATIGDRISAATTTAFTSLAGQITGTGTLEFYAAANGINFLLSNITAVANNWTGGLIVDSAANDNSDLKILADNQLGGNTTTLIQGGTGMARLDLNGFNDTMGGLNSSLNPLNQVADYGSAPSTLTLGAGNASGTFGGLMGGDSAPNSLSLVKIGTGTQKFSGTNTYTGNTLVAGGTLALVGGGVITQSPLITVSNGLFDVSAASTYTSTAALALTNGNFNLGSVVATSLSGLALTNSTLTFPLNQSLPGITVTGPLTTGGMTNIIDLTSVPGLASYPQQVTLILYGSASPGLVTGNNQLATLGVNLPTIGNVTGYLTNNTTKGSIDLVITSGPPQVLPLTWNGEVGTTINGNWDILNTYDWVTTTGRNPYQYQDTSLITFDDTAAGTTTVNLTTMVSPGGIVFNNTNKNYTIGGTGKISGTTALNMTGGGTLTLTESGGDNFSGGINVSNGVVIIDNNSGGVSGGINIAGGTVQVGNHDANGVVPSGTITDNGALSFNRTDTALNVADVIAGTGGVTYNGSGTITISAIATYTGPTVVNAGTLVFATPNANPSGISTSSALIINNGATVEGTIDNSIGLTPATLPITVNAGGTLTGAAIADGGQGTSSHLGGLLTLNGGILTDGGGQIPNLTYGTWDVAGGVAVPGGSVTATIACLNVVPEEAGGTDFNVTNGTTASGIDLLVSGTLINGTTAHDTGIIKNGPGVMVLDGNNSYAGGTTVNGGTLQLGLASDLAPLTTPLGSGSVNLYTDGILNLASSKGVTVGDYIGGDNTGVVLVSGGTNYFTVANYYSGNTLVNAGALVLTGAGAIGGGGAIVVSNATLDVSTSSSAMNNSGLLSLTNGIFNVGTNTASLGSLAISNSTIIFPLNVLAPTLTDSGVFATGGTTNVIKLTVVPGFSVYPTNIPLIQYSSADPNLVNADNKLTTLGLSLPSLGGPVGYLTNLNNAIVLVVLTNGLTPVFPVTWNGRANGVNNGSWDFTTTDWVLTSDDVTPYIYLDTEQVTFDDTLHGTPSLTLATTVSPGGITVSNAVATYIVRGAGKISGNTGITKVNSGTATFAETGGDNFIGGVSVGVGTLILSTANVNIAGGLTVNGGELIDQHSGTIAGGVTLNNYGDMLLLDQSGTNTGNAMINSGTLQVGNGDANGSLPTGTLTNYDTLTFDRSDSALNVLTVINGSGQLINNGPGTVTLSAIETYTGATIVNGGTLAVTGPNQPDTGISTSPSLTINNGGTFMFMSDNAGFGSAVSTSVYVTINAGGTLTGSAAADNGQGTSSHIFHTLTLNGGMLADGGTQINTAYGTWDLNGGVVVNTIGETLTNTSTITCLDVIPCQAGGTGFSVSPGSTPSGIDLLVTGSFSTGTSLPDTGISLSGGGVMALDNNSSYTGGTTVDGGTLQLGTANDTAPLTNVFGTGFVTINNAGSILNFASSMGVTVTNVISDDGSGDTLVLVSRGTNILTAPETYTGNTVVSNGTLVVNGSLAAASAVTVDPQGILSGDGTVGGNVTASGYVAPGVTSAFGDLTCSGNVTLTGGSVMKLGFVTLTNDVLSVGGALTYGGTLNVSALAGTPSGNVTFNLFSAASYSGNFTATNLPALAPGQKWTWNPANGTLTLVQTVNTTPAPLGASVSGNQLTLSWPADHTGWSLQVQTNSPGAGLSNNWVTIPGSTTVNTETFTVNPTNGAVFYRMYYP